PRPLELQAFHDRHYLAGLADETRVAGDRLLARSRPGLQGGMAPQMRAERGVELEALEPEHEVRVLARVAREGCSHGMAAGIEEYRVHLMGVRGGPRHHRQPQLGQRLTVAPPDLGDGLASRSEV